VRSGGRVDVPVRCGPVRRPVSRLFWWLVWRLLLRLAGSVVPAVRDREPFGGTRPGSSERADVRLWEVPWLRTVAGFTAAAP
jgi:hypothetical protein